VNAHLGEGKRETRPEDFLLFRPAKATPAERPGKVHPDAVPGLDARALMKQTLEAGMAVMSEE
jgi:hypothetical protein